MTCPWLASRLKFYWNWNAIISAIKFETSLPSVILLPSRPPHVCSKRFSNLHFYFPSRNFSFSQLNATDSSARYFLRAASQFLLYETCTNDRKTFFLFCNDSTALPTNRRKEFSASWLNKQQTTGDLCGGLKLHISTLLGRVSSSARKRLKLKNFRLLCQPPTQLWVEIWNDIISFAGKVVPAFLHEFTLHFGKISHQMPASQIKTADNRTGNVNGLCNSSSGLWGLFQR